jgi:hypothetical protein
VRRLYKDLFLQVNSEDSGAYVHLMELEIVFGGYRECQPIVAQVSSRCVHSLVIDAFNLGISSTD